ncbi:MAG TPA: ATP-binding protein, partial [Solirubrobacteraceae bacterium]|nr:ATP-binding protein [Solirubrobacteraceae bacterium]
LWLPSRVHLTAPGLRAAIETLIAILALAGAGLLLESFRHDRRRSDLLLLTALAVVGLTDFVFSALPALIGSQIFAIASGAQIACDALAAIAFAAAAFTPAGTVTEGGFRPLRVAAAVAAMTIILATVLDLIGGAPALGGLFPRTGIGAAAAHPVLLLEAMFTGVILLVSAVVFLRRRERDALLLGGASLLLAAARLHYLVLPAVAPGWVTAREGLRPAAYGLLLVVALSRYLRTRGAIAAATLSVERERIARDLHDGLAQDLAFIAVHGQRLSSELGSEHPLTLAAQRAVAVSRGVIVDLSASDAASTEVALRHVANELTARFGAEVVVSVVDGAGIAPWEDLDPDRREDVVRIAREAIVNATRHGQAKHIKVVFEPGAEPVRLMISDDGRGIVAAKLQRRGGYGVQMMRARAAALGGRLTIGPSALGGTDLELTFPSEVATR